MVKQKVHYAKALPNDKAKGSSTPFSFNVMAQLANISACITLYKLLKLFKSIRKALREVLADSETFISQIHVIPEEDDDEHCY